MDAALSEDLIVAPGPFLRFSLFISLLAGNLGLGGEHEAAGVSLDTRLGSAA
jgi:hypothetical protein